MYFTATYSNIKIIAAPTLVLCVSLLLDSFFVVLVKAKLSIDQSSFSQSP